MIDLLFHWIKVSTAARKIRLMLVPLVITSSCQTRSSEVHSTKREKSSPTGLLVLSLGDVAMRRHMDCWIQIPLNPLSRSTGEPRFQEALPLHPSFVERIGFMNHLSRTIESESSLRESYALIADATKGLDKVLGQIVTGDLVGAIPALPSAAFSLGVGLIEGRLEKWRVEKNIQTHTGQAHFQSVPALKWLLLLPDSKNPALHSVEIRFFEALQIALATAPSSLFRDEMENTNSGTADVAGSCQNHLDQLLKHGSDDSSSTIQKSNEVPKNSTDLKREDVSSLEKD